MKEVEFDRLKARRLTSIKQAQGNPNAIASQAFMKQLYGADHLAGSPTGGTQSTVTSISLDDLKSYYTANVTPKNAAFHVVGDVKQTEVENALLQLSAWEGDEVAIPLRNKVANLLSYLIKNKVDQEDLFLVVS